MATANGLLAAMIGVSTGLLAVVVSADGILVPPRDYQGSLEEQAQEAIIVFEPGSESKSAVEHLILKIRVVGEIDNFAWVVPLPSEPQTAPEDAGLFREVFDYVEARRQQSLTPKKGEAFDSANKATSDQAVEVLSRRVVGSYDVAVVKERRAGALNQWLVREGYQRLDDADDVIRFYRDRDYVFACIKVSDAARQDAKTVDLHPLRFSFSTGGRDGIYFPMKITGLQQGSFDVNLYVFYKAWLNDALNRYGYVHRGFRLRHRDWDTRRCKPNAGKTWSAPEKDPYLSDQAANIPKLTAYFQKRHPGQRFYLTNLQAMGLKPENVRQWTDDLWMFPFYVNRDFVPYDARSGGPAAGAWPNSSR